ncbi:MAG TPA: ferredoxin reductase family protein [Patescibacteria group bacterium]|jgi:predicted ferric reductase|nr:ferredoxin reductase family protein [Patescibacteria group bacterium]
MKKTLLYILLVAVFAVTIVSWWHFSGYLLSSRAPGDFLLGIGRLIGLLAGVMLPLQLILIGRVKWVESVFGLDKLSRMHRTNGLIILGLILLHPFLMVLAYSMSNETGLVSQYLLFLKYWDHILLATIGYLMLLGTIMLSLTIIRRKLKYEWWYYVHIFNYIAIAFIFLHTRETTPDSNYLPWEIFWWGIYVFTFFNIMWFRFTRPVLRFWQHKFTVERVVDLGPATSIYITGRNMDKFKIQAGQFMIFRFLQKGFWKQAHPFSMSMAPNGRELRLTAKKLGDFTNELPKILVGTQVLIDGPHGVYTEKLITKQKLLFIAGGIGITPIRSILESLGTRYPDKFLLYSNKSQAETILGDELAELSTKNNFKITNIYDGEQVTGAEFGRLDKTMLARLVPDIAERDIFLCGPPPMMLALRKAMVELGVPKSQIHFERFAL